MKPKDWTKLKFFMPQENWNDPSKMELSFLEELERLREFLNTKIVVISGYRPGKASFHSSGFCADLCFPEWSKHWFDLFMTINRFDFYGIGYYPLASYQGKKIGSYHLDQRHKVKNTPHKAYWIGLHESEGKDPRYVAMNFENLNKYCTL